MIAALLADGTLRVVALGAGVLGCVSGALGSYAVLRRQSLVGDAVSHAALPGIVLAFMLTGSKVSLVLMLGAAVSGWLATLAVGWIVARSRVRYDAALALMLATFFGLGLLLLTHIQRTAGAAQAGLDRYLFGQAAALLWNDVLTMTGLGVAAIGACVLLWKELKLVAFDADYGASLGLPMARLDIVLTALLVVAIVIGLQTVGVILMSAMLVAPAAAARQWSSRLGPLMLIAALIGGASGVAGAVLSSVIRDLPTGPTVVLVLTVVVVVSLAVAPARGLVWQRLQLRRHRRRLPVRAVLLQLAALARHHEDPSHGHPLSSFGFTGSRKDLDASLYALQELGLVRPAGPRLWAPTDAGLDAAQRLEEPR
jgi:manganese/zinc/iron transport system permease protein